MRQSIQNQLVNLLSSVVKGIQYTQTANLDNARSVLEDCLYALEAIESNLQKELSESRFAEYRSRLTGVTESIHHLWSVKQQGGPISDMIKRLEGQVYSLQELLKTETEISYEIVFFPYKASMWDAMESIWKAAKEDPACICYVVPIPYHERNSDRSLGKLCYEGDQFPEDVPITHYSAYDITSRRPDIAYISNPYDGSNYVTSVDPNYYSDVLKQHTDMLVYVPYFFTGGDFPQSQVMLPAYRHVDRIIVQSEKIRNEFAGTEWYEKTIALGSPKADRMIQLEQHKPELPQEWADMIGDRKVVLYNTSISGLLQHGPEFLQKMLYVFQSFMRRQDVVLIWRPHPLSKSTLQSMRPDLLEVYEKIEGIFIREKIGILDTTPDVNKSIALSDAYIGESSSSIVHLFGITGKPVFLLNLETSQEPAEGDKTSVHFLDCYPEGDSIWFVDAGFQALCKMELASGKIDVAAQVPGSTNHIAYCDIQKIGNKLYMLPYYADALCEYDLQKNLFHRTPVKGALLHNNFDRMIHYNDYLFLKPKIYPSIVRYDLRSGEMKYYSECLQFFRDHQLSQQEELFIWGVTVRGNLLLMASAKINQVLEFNMETGESRIHQVGPDGMNYFGMEFDGTDYWLIPNEGQSIIRWNYETGKTVEYNQYPINFTGDQKLFISIVYCGNYLLAFPRMSNMIIKIDVETGKMTQADWQLPYTEGTRKSELFNYVSNYYFAKKIDNERIVALSSYDDRLLVFDIVKEECMTIECRLDFKDRELLTKPLIRRSFGQFYDHMPYACWEDGLYKRVDLFLDYIQSEDHDSEAQRAAYSEILNHTDGTCGVRIHQNMLLEVVGRRYT